MMVFEQVKESVATILSDAAAGRFVTVGHQRQAQAAEQVLDSSRTVQVFFSGSKFGKAGGRLNGPTQSDVTFRIELTVSKAAAADLTTINAEGSTQQQIQTAVAALQESAALAETSWNELARIVYEILMDGRNLGLGLAKGVVANRWVSGMGKDDVLDKGEYVVITGSVVLEARVAEEPPGAVPVAANIVQADIQHRGDNVTRAGVLVDNT